MTYYVGEHYEVENGTGTSYYYANSDRVAKKNATGVFYYHPDHLGSTSVVTDSSGSLIEKTKYAPFGAVLSGGSEKYGYTGQETDDTGLMYYHARYYDPALMRFVEADPVVQDVYDPQGLNRYSYVRNNPIRLTDPTGETFEDSLNLMGQRVQQYGPIGAFIALGEIFESNRQKMWSEDYKNNPQLQQEYRDATTFGPVCVGCVMDYMRENPVGFIGLVVFEGGGLAMSVGSIMEAAVLGGAAGAGGGSTNSNRANYEETIQVPSTSYTTITKSELSPAAQNTIDLINKGGPYPYSRDGIIFNNREGLLPTQPSGYYTEYTVPTEQILGRGAQRIVVGANDEIYYTDNHYGSFTQIMM